MPKPETGFAGRLVDAKTGEELSRDQVVKGFEFDRDRYVTVSVEELKDLQIESSIIGSTALSVATRSIRCISTRLLRLSRRRDRKRDVSR